MSLQRRISQPSVAKGRLQCVITGGSNSIPTLWFIDRCSRFFPERLGRARKYIVMVLVALIPVLAQATIQFPFQHLRPAGVALDRWILYFAGFHVFALVCPDTTWRQLIDGSASVESLLAADRNIEHVADWYRRRLRPCVQLGMLLIGACIGVSALLGVRAAISRHIEVNSAALMSTGLTGAIAGSNLFWVLNLTLFVREVLSLDELALRWNDPVSSVGIDEMTHLLTKTFVLAMVGVAGAGWAVLSAYAVSKDPTVRTALVWLLVTAIVVVSFVGIAPQIWISNRLRRAKLQTLDLLSTLLRRGPSVQMTEKEVEATRLGLEIYEKVRAISAYTLRPETIGPYVAAVIAALIPFVLQALISH